MSQNPQSAWCLRLLRRFREATLGYGDRRAPSAFVIDRMTGMVVMPVEPEAARQDDLTLYAPSESDCDVTILLSPAAIPRPEASEPVDRWSAYHGPPPAAVVWIAARVLGVKSMSDAEDSVMDEAALTVPNSLGNDEFRLIRLANADRPLLSRAAAAMAGAAVPDPSCVGIDPDGIDIRAPFGIVRLEFPYAAADIPTAELMLKNLLSAGGAST